jgi:predicted DNA-binding transcriptional regulator YafY
MAGNNRKLPTNRERLQVIDELLSSNQNVGDRDQFLRKVNARMSKKVTKETLDKDIKRLREYLDDDVTEVKILYSRQGGYRYSLSGYSYFRNPIRQEDKYLLELAANLFGQFQGTSLQEEFSAIVNKVLTGGMTEVPVKGINDVECIHPEVPTSDQGTKWIKPLLKDIFARQVRSIEYKPYKKAISTKIISPYLIKFHNNRWYLVAHDQLCTRSEKTNVYALDCIKSLGYPGSKYKFVQDVNFSASNYFKYSLGIWHWYDKEPIKVSLEFSDMTEEILTNPLHQSQKMISADRCTKLVVEIEVYPSPELERKILQYGDKVKVLAPDHLADRISAIATNIAKLYR